MANELELAKEYAGIIRMVISEQMKVGSLASATSKSKIVAILNDINSAVNKATVEPTMKKKILTQTGRELEVERPDSFPDLIIGSINVAQIKESSRLSEFLKRMKVTMNKPA